MDGKLAKVAQRHAFSEFKKYRVKQDRLYQSDFDRVLLEGMLEINDGENDGEKNYE